MAFYVRHTAAKVIWRVHKVPADAPDGIISREEALTYPLSEKTNQGFYGDEFEQGIHLSLSPLFVDRLFGPFENAEEAREVLWVEDV